MPTYLVTIHEDRVIEVEVVARNEDAAEEKAWEAALAGDYNVQSENATIEYIDEADED